MEPTYQKVIDFLRGEVGGADGKTVWEELSRLAERAEIPAVRFRSAVQYLERRGLVEVLRTAEGDRNRVSGVRLLRAPVPHNGNGNGKRLESTAGRKVLPFATGLPPTPKLDEAAASLDLVRESFGSVQPNIQPPPIIQEALALRAWVKEHYQPVKSS